MKGEKELEKEQDREKEEELEQDEEKAKEQEKEGHNQRGKRASLRVTRWSEKTMKAEAARSDGTR